MAVIINNMHMPTTCTMCWISNTCQEHIHDLKHIGYDRRLDDCPLQELPSVEPHYDLDGYSSRLWKAAYERGKAEAERKKGKWILQEDKAQPLYGWHICSECGEAYIGENYSMSSKPPVNFCPNCGADMRGDKDEISD